jgi:hypothetical protein
MPISRVGINRRFSFSILHNDEVSTSSRMMWFVLLVLLTAAQPLPAKTKTAPALTSEYIAALGVANRFLDSWQTQDYEKGLLLLGVAAKHQMPEDRLQVYFSPHPPTERACEIGRGKKLKDGRYSFPLTLLETASGQDPKAIRPRASHVIVSKAGKDDWVIDKLP